MFPWLLTPLWKTGQGRFFFAEIESGIVANTSYGTLVSVSRICFEPPERKTSREFARQLGIGNHESASDRRKGKPVRHHRTALRRDRRPDGSGGCSSEGDGLRDGCRLAGCGRPVYRVHPDGDLRAARLVAGAERQLHHHAGDPRRHAARTGRAGRRPGEAGHGDGHADGAGRCNAALGAADASGVCRQLHFRAGADGLQSGDRPGDRARPGAEAPGSPHRQARLLPRSPERRASHPRDLAIDACGRQRDAARADRHGATLAAFPGPAGRRRRRHRRGVVFRLAGPGGVDGRPDPTGLPVADAA